MRQDDQFEQDDDSGRNPVRDRMKQLETELAEVRAKAAEAEAAQRKLAFIEAGVDINTPTGKLFAKAYDGEFSLDAVKAAATEYGLIGEPPRVNADSGEQKAWMQAAASHSTGAPAPSAGDITQAIRKAKNPEELKAIMAQFQASQSG
jgi:hypothetical protein